MDTLEHDLGAEMERDIAAHSPAPRAPGTAEIFRRIQPAVSTPAQADPIARQADVHRQAVARHHREMLTIERARDIAVRGYEADLAEARLAFVVEEARLNRLISEAKGQADRRLAIRKQLSRSSEAALMALEPTPAEREAPTGERRVPRVVKDTPA